MTGIGRNNQPQENGPLRIVILASGVAYQKAAAAAAATYLVNRSPSAAVTVLVPENEEISELLARHSTTFGFTVVSFPFSPGRPENITALVKCQAYVWVLERSKAGETVFFVDADTCCLKPFSIVGDLRKAIILGKVGFAQDICDRHFKNNDGPWYLQATERLDYVNSGVLAASCASLPFFSFALNLARQTKVFIGPMQDQTLMNFALGRHFPDLLLLLPRALNSINCVTDDTVIAHFAGGAGLIGKQPRQIEHLQACKRILSSGAEGLSRESG